ncbi:hypothetical protein [Fodinicurvata sp. EGI_FJ10296]|uniref:hypothetical protein n=1 Tax=Fodinicurvata sp. EGI_FJ10296 TaxID=3231908 RepID=UPI0034548981
MTIDPDRLVATLHRDLMARQWAALAPAFDSALAGHADRMAASLVDGVHMLQTYADAEGFDGETFQALVEGDARLEFMFSLPRSAGLGGRIAEALATGLHGATNMQTRQLGQWIYVFIRLLDGLIDNAPDLLTESDRSDLQREIPSALTRDGPQPLRWADTTHRHPATALLWRTALFWTEAVRESAAWRRDPTIRNAVAQAAREALAAEFRTPCLRFSRTGSDLSAIGRDLDSKTRTTTWCMALMPVCVDGSPAECDLDQYRNSMDALGDYLEWIDDIQDLVEDANADSWNVPLIEFAARNRFAAHSTYGDTPSRLGRALSDAPTTEALIAIGVGRLSRAVSALEAAGLDCPPLRCLLGDLTATSLDGPK